MSLPWVKLHVPLLDNEDYKRFSPQAQHLYMTLLALAGKQDRGDYSGRLETSTGPLTISEVRAYARYPVAQLRAGLDQLLAAGFISRDAGGTLIIERFKEKAAPLDVIRSRANRERTANARHTDGVRSETEPEAEAEADRRIPSPSAPGKASEKAVVPPADLAAYLILDAVYPVVLEQHPDLAFSRNEWRTKNKRAAKALSEQGKTPAQVVGALNAAYGHKFAGYHEIVMLDKLREHWTKLSGSKRSASPTYKTLTPEDAG